jgi:hypothetical protein
MKLRPPSDAKAALGIYLKVRIQILVAGRAVEASQRVRVPSPVREKGLVSVLKNVRAVIGQANADGKTATVVGRADVPGIWCLTQERRTIVAKRAHAGDLRPRVAIIRGDAETAQQAGKVREVTKQRRIACFCITNYY